jgi:hypothetical protein
MGDQTKPADRLVRVLSGSKKPLSARQLCLSLMNSIRVRDVHEVQAVLTHLVDTGTVTEWPPVKGYKAPRYSLESPRAQTGARIVAYLRRSGKLRTENQARQALPRSLHPFFDEALGKLIAERQVFTLRKARAVYLVDKAPMPSQILSAKQMKLLCELVDFLAPHRKPRLTLEMMLGFIDGVAEETSPRPPAPRMTRELLEEWYRGDLPRLRGGLSVPIPWTWRRYRTWAEQNGHTADTAMFQATLKELAASRDVELIPHSRTEPIPQEEFDILFENERGQILYFWRWRSGGRS